MSKFSCIHICKVFLQKYFYDHRITDKTAVNKVELAEQYGRIVHDQKYYAPIQQCRRRAIEGKGRKKKEKNGKK